MNGPRLKRILQDIGIGGVLVCAFILLLGIAQSGQPMPRDNHLPPPADAVKG